MSTFDTGPTWDGGYEYDLDDQVVIDVTVYTQPRASTVYTQPRTLTVEAQPA